MASTLAGSPPSTDTWCFKGQVCWQLMLRGHVPGDVASKLFNSSQTGSPTLSFGRIPWLPGKRCFLEMPEASENVRGGNSWDNLVQAPISQIGRLGISDTKVSSIILAIIRKVEATTLTKFYWALIMYYSVLLCAKNSTYIISFNLQKNFRK